MRLGPTLHEGSWCDTWWHICASCAPEILPPLRCLAWLVCPKLCIKCMSVCVRACVCVCVYIMTQPSCILMLRRSDSTIQTGNCKGTDVRSLQRIDNPPLILLQLPSAIWIMPVCTDLLNWVEGLWKRLSGVCVCVCVVLLGLTDTQVDQRSSSAAVSGAV